MAARLIEETDVIDVSNPPVLIYGQPGAGKTSLAQTADKPLTLDFDGGIHRSQFRKAAMRFDAWEDVVAEQHAKHFDPYQTIVLDTVDNLLKYMGHSIIRDNAKMGTRAGGLSLQGFGVLKTTFDNWVSGMRQAGKQLIFVCHQKEDKDGDDRRLRPDIMGGSYSIVMNNADIVGYVSYRNNKRFVGWEPTDAYFAKNGAQLKSQPIPDFTENPHFMAELLATAKSNLGHTAQASAAVAKATDEWQARIAGFASADQLNAALPDLGKLTNGTKRQVWHMLQEFAASYSLEFDKASKLFVSREAA